MSPQVHAGPGVGTGKDYTLFALRDGEVLFSLPRGAVLRSSRLARVSLEIRDVPGELGKAADLLGSMGANN